MSDYSGYESEFPDPRVDLGYKQCISKPSTFKRECMIEVYKNFGGKTMSYSQDQLKGYGKGTRWLKLSYVTNFRIDKKLCFSLNCGTFRTKSYCFDNPK